MLQVDTVISTFVGMVSGWITAYYFFKKARPADKVFDQIKYGLQNALLPILYPKFYDPDRVLTVYPEQVSPQNTDIPFVEYAIFSEKAIYRNQKIDVLLKIRDSGLDLDVPHGVTIRDHRDNYVGVVAIGFGFVRISFNTGIEDRFATHKLTVNLQDTGEQNGRVPHNNTQSLLFSVVKGDLP